MFAMRGPESVDSMALIVRSLAGATWISIIGGAAIAVDGVRYDARVFVRDV